MNNAHTPGPWHRNIKPATKYNTIFAGRNTHIARLVVDGLSEQEVEANCDLIARAPALLAENERLRAGLEAAANRFGEDSDNAESFGDDEREKWASDGRKACLVALGNSQLATSAALAGGE